MNRLHLAYSLDVVPPKPLHIPKPKPRHAGETESLLNRLFCLCLRLNGEEAFQFIRCQVFPVFVRHVKPFLFGKVLNGVKRYQTVTHRLVENSLYCFFKQYKGKISQFAAVSLDLTGIPVIITNCKSVQFYHFVIYSFLWFYPIGVNRRIAQYGRLPSYFKERCPRRGDSKNSLPIDRNSHE